MTEPAFTRRHWGREALDLVLFPLSMLTSKATRGRELSMLRVVIGVELWLVWRVLDAGGHFTEPDVWVMLVVAAALPVSDLFGMVPVREGLAALVAVFGGSVSKHVSKSTLTTETMVQGPAEVGEGDV